MNNKIKIISEKIIAKTIKYKWGKDMAGRKMIKLIPIVSPGDSIEKIKNQLADKIKNKYIDTINYIYVVDYNKKLVGVFSIKKIFKEPNSKQAKDIMIKNLISVSPKTDQEDVVWLALKNNIKSIPVVDKNQVLLGIVPSDKILKILDKEYGEDLLHIAGIYAPGSHLSNILSVSLIALIKQRIPWLIIGLGGGLLSAAIIGFFKESLEENLILAMFIPIIVYMSGAVGSQTRVLFVRDMAMTSKLPLLKYYLKHIKISFSLAIFLSSLLFLVVFFVGDSFNLALALGIAMLLTILWAAVLSLVLPYLLNRFKFDPALSAGPFTTTIQDISSIIIYFLTANIIL